MASWWVAVPVPFLLMYAESWSWVIAANLLLGINQGLAWSSTVIMKVDMVGQKNRGLAMGINEFAGYLSVGQASYLASRLAASYGYAYFPFIPGLFFVLAGLLLSGFFVRDTTRFVQTESATSKLPIFAEVWKETTWKHKNISTVTLNGLINNMNDAIVWGLLPLLLCKKNSAFSKSEYWPASIRRSGESCSYLPAKWEMYIVKNRLLLPVC
jgi:hypothetical protein